MIFMAIPETVTGTGTQSDPYIVSTWQEIVDTVVEEPTSTPIYVKVKENTVMDLNEYSDYVPCVDVNGGSTCHIDFNGAVVVNGKFNTVFDPGDTWTTSNYPLYIRNLVMLNCRVDRANGMNNNDSGASTYFEDCVLDIYLTSPDACFINSGGNDFTRSKITVRGNGVFCKSGTFKDCDVDIRLNTSLYTSATEITYQKIGESNTTEYSGEIYAAQKYAPNSYRPTFNDCHVTGKLSLPENAEGFTIFYAYSSNSIFELECDIIALGGSASSKLNLNNSDKAILPISTTIGSTAYTPAGPLYERNTEEIRDAQVLYELGFSIDPSSITTS